MAEVPVTVIAPPSLIDGGLTVIEVMVGSTLSTNSPGTLGSSALRSTPAGMRVRSKRGFPEFSGNCPWSDRL